MLVHTSGWRRWYICLPLHVERVILILTPGWREAMREYGAFRMTQTKTGIAHEPTRLIVSIRNPVLCSKAFIWYFFSIPFKASNYQIVGKNIVQNFLLKLSDLKSDFTLILGYLNQTTNNPAQGNILGRRICISDEHLPPSFLILFLPLQRYKISHINPRTTATAMKNPQ